MWSADEILLQGPVIDSSAGTGRESVLCEPPPPKVNFVIVISLHRGRAKLPLCRHACSSIGWSSFSYCFLLLNHQDLNTSC